MIPAAQIDYMLAGRLSDEALLQQIRARDKWLWLMRASDVCVGYCGHELAPGDGVTPAAMKLGQLYVLPSHRGTGLGGFMLGHVEAQARAHGRRLLFLQVNKRNTSAIGFYRAMGFQVVREAVKQVRGVRPESQAPAVAPHTPRCSADACRSAIRRPILRILGSARMRRAMDPGLARVARRSANRALPHCTAIRRAWLPASTKAASARRSPSRRTDRTVCECRDVSESRSISHDGRARTTGAS